MTTDPFTDAARAEAERYFADPGVDPLTLSVIDHAMHMAEWARTHLAAQEPTDAEVEAACRGFYNDPNSLTDWAKLARIQPDLADKYRAGMRRALSAARAALSAARAARRDEEKR